LSLEVLSVSIPFQLTEARSQEWLRYQGETHGLSGPTLGDDRKVRLMES